jgi:hypothetical protein
VAWKPKSQSCFEKGGRRRGSKTRQISSALTKTDGRHFRDRTEKDERLKRDAFAENCEQPMDADLQLELKEIDQWLKPAERLQ